MSKATKIAIGILIFIVCCFIPVDLTGHSSQNTDNYKVVQTQQTTKKQDSTNNPIQIKKAIQNITLKEELCIIGVIVFIGVGIGMYAMVSLSSKWSRYEEQQDLEKKISDFEKDKVE